MRNLILALHRGPAPGTRRGVCDGGTHAVALVVGDDSRSQRDVTGCSLEIATPAGTAYVRIGALIGAVEDALREEAVGP